MNKTMIYGMLTALFALASCMGNGNPVSLSDLEGEWNVVELAGQSVNTKQQPFIGFDTREMIMPISIQIFLIPMFTPAQKLSESL